MVIPSHYLTMNDRVGVAELKARLREYLRRVRGGETVTVLNRNREIARIVPLESADPLSVRERSGSIERLAEVPLPPPLEIEVDILVLLAEERHAGR